MMLILFSVQHLAFGYHSGTLKAAGAYAIVGAAAMLRAARQAPLTGLALMLELASGGFGIMIPMVAASVVARQVDGYSIYTAWLRAR